MENTYRLSLELFPLTGGCSEGLEASYFSLKKCVGFDLLGRYIVDCRLKLLFPIFSISRRLLLPWGPGWGAAVAACVGRTLQVQSAFLPQGAYADISRLDA